jgi:hypothetical protein
MLKIGLWDNIECAEEAEILCGLISTVNGNPSEEGFKRWHKWWAKAGAPSTAPH